MNRYLQLFSAFWIQDFNTKIRLLKMIGIIIYAFILVRYVPLKFYFKTYILNTGGEITNKFQLLPRDNRQLRKLMRLFPFRITCMMESLAFHLYYKSNHIFIPINIGLKTEGQLEAHAWNFFGQSAGYSGIN